MLPIQRETDRQTNRQKTEIENSNLNSLFYKNCKETLREEGAKKNEM